MKKLLLLAAVSSALPASAAVYQKTLADLGHSQPIRLQGSDASFIVKIPVSPRENLQAVKVVLDYANSTALQENRSSLVLRINDQIISQDVLRPVGGNKLKEVVIPRSLLRVGYNELKLQAIQHYTYSCEDQNSSELWTEINQDRSKVMAAVSGLKYNARPNLSQMGIVFDPRLWTPQTVTVVAGSGYASDAALTASALAAQGIALRKQSVPNFKWVAGDDAYAAGNPQRALPGLNLEKTAGDVLLIGRKSEISRYLDTTTYQTINGAYLGLTALDADGRVAVIISGETDEQVLEAAKVFADPEQVTPAEQAAVVKALPWHAPKLVQPQEVVPFSALGYRTSTLQGLRPGQSQLSFNAPADYAAKKGDLSSMKLHFAYAGGIRADSTFVMKLNGHFVNSVPLNNVEGQEFTKMEVSLPSEYILPGRNLITFEPVFMTNKEQCGMIRDEHMHLTIYEDSSLELSRATIKPAAPDLARFGLTGWPYVKDQNQLFINIRDNRAYEAMLTTVASLANNAAAPRMWQVTTNQPKDGDYLLIGDNGALDNTIRAGILGAMPRGGQLQMAQAVIGEKTKTQVVTTITTESVSSLLPVLDAFQKSNQWQKLDGAAAMFNQFDKSIQSVQSPNKVVIESSSGWGGIKELVDRWNYSQYVLWAVGLGLLLALSLRSLTNRKQKSRDEQ